MKNVPSTKGWMMGTTRPHVDPPQITIIKSNHNGKSDKYSVKLKLRRDPMSSMSDLYEFKMSLLENDEPEKFLFFVRNFNTTLVASGALEAGAKHQYFCTLVCREALRQFYLWSDDVEVTQTLNIDYIFKCLAQYISPINLLSEQKRDMLCGMKKHAL